MASLKSPLIDLMYNDETGRYIAALERKILLFTLNEIKFRALLELLTDEPWDDYQFKEEDGAIRKLAVDALMRRLNIPEDDASRLVAERWERHNPEPASEESRTYLIGKTPTTPHVVTQSRNIGSVGGYNLEKHKAGLEMARQMRLPLDDS